MGNWTTDNAIWERPEDDKSKRSVYYVTTKNGVRVILPVLLRRLRLHIGI